MKEFLKVFKALGDQTRIRIIKILQERPLCVCEITEILGISQSSISHHLRVLENAGLVEYKRDGQWINYDISKVKENNYVIKIVGLLKDWFNDNQVVKQDVKAVKIIDRNNICKK